MKVGDTVKYIGDESDDIPFKKDDLVLLKREEADGYAAVPFNKPKSKEATLVYLEEVAEIEEDDAEYAADEAKQDAAEDKKIAKAKKAKQKKADAAAVKKDAKAKKKAAAPKKKAAAKKSEKKVAAPKKEKAATTDADVLIISKEVKAALKGKDAVEVARDLISGRALTDYKLGGVLAVIEENKEFLTFIDPDTEKEYTNDIAGFESFVENELGFKYRKAKFLIKYYSKASKLNLPAAKLAKASYTKMREVIDIMEAEPENAEAWLDKANESTQRDLAGEARRYERKIGIEKKPRGNNDATMVSTKRSHLRRLRSSLKRRTASRCS